MKVCRNPTELSDQAIFCHACGRSESPRRSPFERILRQQAVVSKTVIYVMILALAIMGLTIIGLTLKGPVTVTQTDYITKVQFATVSVTSSATMTQIYTLTGASIATTSSGPTVPFNQQYCGYPFNPYLCNEGPPVTLTGYLTNDSACVYLYVATGQNYVVWNLPSHYPTGGVQVYGFIYPDWPQTQVFPPYPFQRVNCIGIPMWAIPPYIKSV